MDKNGEKEKEDLIVIEYTGFSFNHYFYDSSFGKCAAGIFL